MIYHKRRKHNFGICHYHLCRKRTKVYKCKYCGEFFCYEHLEAKPPGLPNFETSSHKDRLFMEEWHKPGGHPCVPYLEHWKAENERKEQEYRQALDRLIRSKPIQFEKEEKRYETKYEEEPTKKPRYIEKHEEPKIERKTNHVKYVIGVLAILFIVYLFLNFSGTNLFFGNVLNCTDGTPVQNCSLNKPFFCEKNGNLVENPNVCGCPENKRIYQNKCIPTIKCNDGTLDPECSKNKPYQCVNGTLVKKATICGCPDNYLKKGDDCKLIQRCSDGTIYDECSTKKPLFCSNGNLINKATVCGCPYGSTIRQEGENCIDLSKPDIPLLEKKIHNLINIERQKYGLSQLDWNDKIALAARGHSEDMLKRNYFEHDSPEGHDFSWRYSQVGFSCNIYVGNYIYSGAENIHQGWTYGTIWYTNGVETSREWYSSDKIAENAVNGWMNSPGHRENILTPYWKNEGIGVAVSSDGKVLVTQDFC